jgi:hypothetical protein
MSIGLKPHLPAMFFAYSILELSFQLGSPPDDKANPQPLANILTFSQPFSHDMAILPTQRYARM